METKAPPQPPNIPPDDEAGSRVLPGGEEDDLPAVEIARLVMAGGAFAWLEDEPDLYDDPCGEPTL